MGFLLLANLAEHTQHNSGKDGGSLGGSEVAEADGVVLPSIKETHFKFFKIFF